MHLVLIKGTHAEKELHDLKKYALENIIKLDENQELIEVDDYQPHRRSLLLSDPTGESKTYDIVFTIDSTIGHIQDLEDMTKEVKTVSVLLRHLSMMADGDYPCPISVFTICKFLGFEGSLEDWSISQHPNVEGALVVIQTIPAPEIPKHKVIVEDIARQKGTA